MPKDRPEVVDIGCRKQLFADDHIIGELDNVYRVMNRPVKYADNPVLELSRFLPHRDDTLKNQLLATNFQGRLLL